MAGSADMHEDVLIQPHRLDETFSYTIRLARTVAAGLVQSVPERGEAMTANVTEGRAPEWKYQRQFDHGEGVSTRTRRASLVVEKEPVLLDDERMRFFSC